MLTLAVMTMRMALVNEIAESRSRGAIALAHDAARRGRNLSRGNERCYLKEKNEKDAHQMSSDMK